VLKNIKIYLLKLLLSFTLSAFLLLSNVHAQSLNFLPETELECEYIEHSYFSLCYSEQDEQAIWVAYMLTSEMVQSKECSRSNDFRPDKKVSTASASLADYKGSGYDRGHLCPAADMNFNCTAMSESFLMSNMSPQAPSFNRGIWSKLENLVRVWAILYDTLYVVTAGIPDEHCLGAIGDNNVSIPKYFYKAIYRKTSDGGTCIAFLLNNEGSSDNLDNFVITIDELEALTFIDFFSFLPDTVENKIEKQLNKEKWDFSGKK